MERRAFRVDPRLLELARDMRGKPAPCEQKLWYCLRNRRLNGFKFQRQFPIDRYVADFYCAECRVVIELDGESHFGEEENDAQRTSRLNELGFAVVRFSNVDVHENLESVLLAILRECEEPSRAADSRESRNSKHGPSPQPSPPSTGERKQEPMGVSDK